LKVVAEIRTHTAWGTGREIVTVFLKREEALALIEAQGLHEDICLSFIKWDARFEEDEPSLDAGPSTPLSAP